jgi:hypothetical protein
MLDPNRAAFVKQEYRYATKLAPTVLARNPAARVVEVETNLDEASATALANKYLAENVEPRVFDVTLEGVIHIDAFVGGPPRYIPDFPRLATDGRAMKVISASVDYDAGRTTVRIRG